MRSGQRRFTIGLAGCVALALSLALILGREGLRRAYYLEALRKSPARLEEMLLSKSSSMEAAARDFLAEPEGKKAFFRLYLDEYDRNQPGFATRQFLLNFAKTKVDRGILAIWEDGYFCHTWTGTTSQSSFSMANVAESPSRRAVILELLRLSAGETFRLPDLPLEFQIQPRGTPPRWPGAALDGAGPPSLPSTPPEARFLCFFRVLAKAGND